MKLTYSLHHLPLIYYSLIWSLGPLVHRDSNVGVVISIWTLETPHLTFLPQQAIDQNLAREQNSDLPTTHMNKTSNPFVFENNKTNGTTYQGKQGKASVNRFCMCVPIHIYIYMRKDLQSVSLLWMWLIGRSWHQQCMHGDGSWWVHCESLIKKRWGVCLSWVACNASEGFV